MRRGPNLSRRAPAINAMTAELSDASVLAKVISARVQPNSFSSGTTKTPNVTKQIVLALNAKHTNVAATSHQPKKMLFGTTAVCCKVLIIPPARVDRVLISNAFRSTATAIELKAHVRSRGFAIRKSKYRRGSLRFSPSEKNFDER